MKTLGKWLFIHPRFYVGGSHCQWQWFIGQWSLCLIWRSLGGLRKHALPKRLWIEIFVNFFKSTSCEIFVVYKVLGDMSCEKLNYSVLSQGRDADAKFRKVVCTFTLLSDTEEHVGTEMKDKIKVFSLVFPNYWVILLEAKTSYIFLNDALFWQKTSPVPPPPPPC